MAIPPASSSSTCQPQMLNRSTLSSEAYRRVRLEHLFIAKQHLLRQAQDRLRYGLHCALQGSGRSLGLLRMLVVSYVEPLILP